MLITLYAINYTESHSELQHGTTLFFPLVLQVLRTGFVRISVRHVKSAAKHRDLPEQQYGIDMAQTFLQLRDPAKQRIRFLFQKLLYFRNV